MRLADVCYNYETDQQDYECYKKTNAWEERTVIESFGFVEMYLAVPLTLWKTIQYKLSW
jgi:hypothetical protein